MRGEPARIPLAAVGPAAPADRITTAADSAELARAVDHVGLLAPPFLIPEGDRYRVVAGNRRLAAVQALGWAETPALRIPADTPPLDRVRLAVADNAFQRPLNPLEQARALRALSAHFADVDALAAEARRLNLPDHPALIQKLRPLPDLPEVVQSALLTEAVALPMALELAPLPAAHQIALVELFGKLGLSLSRQREFLTLLDEIAAREERALPDLLREPTLRTVLDDPDMDRPRKAGELRRRLRRRRFPAITAAEARYQRIVAELPLGPDLRLTPPRDFEGTTYTVTAKFEDRETLERRVRQMAELAQCPGMRHLLDEP
jgi:ParB family chromosome partitioning protein